MSEIDGILQRIDAVLEKNRRVELILVVLAVALCGSGITCLITALVTSNYLWSSPSALTTALLYWPIRQIHDIRRKNIALAVAPVLITLLSREKAEEEIRVLLGSLYGKD